MSTSTTWCLAALLITGDTALSPPYLGLPPTFCDQWYDAFASEMESDDENGGRSEAKRSWPPPPVPPQEAEGEVVESRRHHRARASSRSRRNRLPPDEGAAPEPPEGKVDGDDLHRPSSLASRSEVQSSLSTERAKPGPRAKPGLEVCFSVSLRLNLVRRPVPGEVMVPGMRLRGKTWLERCRIVAMGISGGFVREPSDGWGSPPPQHRAWGSVVSITAGVPPSASHHPPGYRPGEAGCGHGGGRVDPASRAPPPSFAGSRPSDREAARSATPGRGDGGGGALRPDSAGGTPAIPPYLICRAALDLAPEESREDTREEGECCSGGSSSGNDRDRGRGGSLGGEKFLDVRAAGRAGCAGGAGSCLSLLMKVGDVEAWALAGAVTRWLERLGPKVRGE